MKREERLKYLTALISIAASMLAAISFAFVVENEFINGVKEIAPKFILLTTIAAAMTVFASISMLSLVRSRRLRERVRRVFIIYARKDLPIAQEITALLKENGLEPWLDIDNITAGQIWMDEISKALDESAMAVVLISKNTTDSSYAAKELKSAISDLESNDKKSSPLIPVLIDGAEIPTSISHIQFVDYRQDNAKDFLVRSIEVAMDKILGSEKPA